MAHGLAVAQHPHFPDVDLVEQAFHFGALAGEFPLQLVRIAEDIPAFLVAIAMEYRDEVVKLPAAQRIVHEMGFRSRPQHDVVLPEVVRHFERSAPDRDASSRPVDRNGCTLPRPTS